MQFINIGFGNVVNSDKVYSIVSPDAAPVKRLIQQAKDQGAAIDATCGRKTKAVLVLDNQTTGEQAGNTRPLYYPHCCRKPLLQE